MLEVGLNPYGLTYTLGLQGQGTPRANPNGRGLEGFIEIADRARREDARDLRALAREDDRRRARRAARPAAATRHAPGRQLRPADGRYRQLHPLRAAALGAKIIRFALTPVLCGDRAALGDRNGRSWSPTSARSSPTTRRKPPSTVSLSSSRTTRILPAASSSISATSSARTSASSTTPATAFPSPRRRSISRASIAAECAPCASQGLQRAVHRRGLSARALRDRRRRGALSGDARDPRRTPQGAAGGARAGRARGPPRAAFHARLVARLSAEIGRGAGRLPAGRAKQPAAGRRRLPHALGARRRRARSRTTRSA